MVLSVAIIFQEIFTNAKNVNLMQMVMVITYIPFHRLVGTLLLTT